MQVNLLHWWDFVKETALSWTMLCELGHGGSQDRKRGWDTQKQSEQRFCGLFHILHSKTSLLILLTLVTSPHEYSLVMVHYRHKCNKTVQGHSKTSAPNQSVTSLRLIACSVMSHAFFFFLLHTCGSVLSDLCFMTVCIPSIKNKTKKQTNNFVPDSFRKMFSAMYIS